MGVIFYSNDVLMKYGIGLKVKGEEIMIRDYAFPDRQIVNSDEWNELCEKTNIDSCYGYPLDEKREFYGFDNEMFTIRPYYWGEDEAIKELPNFLYKPTGFEIEWYKYAFRASYMNQDLSKEQILDIFKECIKSI
jgi:hypothetical protein